MRKALAIVLVLSVLTLTLCGCSLFGNEPENITLSDTQLELHIGDSYTIDITAEPDSAELKKLTWSSSNSNIASVEDGVINAKAAGNTSVTVKTDNGITKSCNVKVVDKDITKISLNSSAVSVIKGKTVRLTPTLTPADASTDNLAWTSSDGSIAIVNSDGIVTGVKAGVANVVCKAPNSVEASCTVTVEDPNTRSSNSGGTTVNNYYGHFNPSYSYSANDFVFPDSSIRQLTTSEIVSTLNNVSGYSPSSNYAQDAINEIYARNGYVFKTASIRDYYASKPWYYADPSFSTSDFNSTENYNIKLLMRYT